MKYMIRLSIMPSRAEAFFRCQDVLCVQRDPENMLETLVIIITPKGPQPFKVLETPEEVAKSCDEWWVLQLNAESSTRVFKEYSEKAAQTPAEPAKRLSPLAIA